MLALLFAPALSAQDVVVVESNVPFFSTATSSKPFLHAQNAEGYSSLEMLERKGKRVRVKISPTGFQCYGSPGQRGLELMLWIDGKDLETVTTKDLRWTLKDDSEVNAAPGVVVKNGKVKIKASSITLPVSKADRGKSFKKVSVRGAVRNAAENRDVLFRSMKGESRCIRILRKEGSTLGKDPRGQLIRPGSDMFTRTGDRIGRTRGRLMLHGEPAAYGDRRCYPFSMLASTEAQICVLVDKLVDHPPERQKGHANFGKINVVGGDLAGVQKALRRRVSAFRACYETALRSESTLAGVVAVQLKINARGKVTSSTLMSSTLQSPVVERCLNGVLRRIRFPNPIKEMVVDIPFSFSVKK